MLPPDKVDEAARILVDARRRNVLIDSIPQACRPNSLADAYAVQDRFMDMLGTEVGGWFGACTNTAIQELLGLDEPYYARLLAPCIHVSPTRLDTSLFPPIVLECEFAFRVGADLPARARAYSRTEVEGAVVSVHPAIEVVAGHLQNWPEQDVFSVIADNGTDGALVHGTGVEDWRSLDLVAMGVELAINGTVERRGTGERVLGDPMAAFTWLVNALSRDGRGVRQGHIHNTGTATDIYWAKPGDHAQARFAGLGEVTLTLM
jgi:2-keto-4-pentenoate hydratase